MMIMKYMKIVVLLFIATLLMGCGEYKRIYNDLEEESSTVSESAVNTENKTENDKGKGTSKEISSVERNRENVMERLAAYSNEYKELFAGSGEKFLEKTYPYLKVFDETDTSTGDRTRYVLLTDYDNLTYDMLEEYWNEEEGTKKFEVYQVAVINRGNSHADITGDEAWHDLATEFDESEVLIDKDRIASLKVINGDTGAEKKVSYETEGKEFADIIVCYGNLDFQPSNTLEERIGYNHMLRLYDSDGDLLQTVIPYKDAVRIDGVIYDGSMNGTTTELLIKLNSIW